MVFRSPNYHFYILTDQSVLVLCIMDAPDLVTTKISYLLSVHKIMRVVSDECLGLNSDARRPTLDQISCVRGRYMLDGIFCYTFQHRKIPL